ncbi:CsbD family protein [Mycobacterium sp. CPCC 205372]|uniref:CsbD family protein n=2 Tax=Mycobacteriaceae TaxID=1762 RepID=A0A9X3BX53_9MYCO|nr:MULTISPECIES: CsbD family protein [Mycobacteriaceae]MCV7172366.1 CsbD family protein [[Mycobacterium] manitobense]MCZ8380908.1 CsbD family protein [Mycobacterium hippophais]
MTIGKTIAHQAEAARGATKKILGRAVGNTRLRTEGRAEQAKANAKQSGAKLKDVFKR